MTDDKLNFLDDDLAATDEPEQVEPEAEVQAEAESVDGDSDPQEVSEEPAPETGEVKEAVPPTADGKNGHAPLTALLDEREKRQDAQRQLEAVQRQLAEMQKQQQPQERPDFYENPDQAVGAQVYQARLEQSRFFATEKYGEELVNEAYAYYDQNPQETAAFRNHPSPFHAAVEQYKRNKFMAEVKDPDEWKAQQIALLREQALTEVAAQSQTSKPTAPPPSMARATAAGKDANPKGSAFDEVFS